MPDVQPLADYSSNPSGIGASVLPDVDGLSDILDKEDESYQNSLNELAKRKAKSAAALSDLMPNLTGILDSDAPYFNKQGIDLLNLAKKATATGKSVDDYTNPYFWQILQAKNLMASEVQASIGQKQQLTQIQAEYKGSDKFDPDNYDKVIANVRSQATPTLRAKLDLSEALKKRPDDLDTLMDSYIKNANPKPVTTESVVADPNKNDPGSLYNRTTTQNITSPQIQAFGNGYRTQPAINTAVQATWQDMKAKYPGLIPQMMKKYTDPVSEGGQGLAPVQAEEAAQKEWVIGKMEGQHHDTSNKDQFSHYTASTKEQIAAAGAGSRAAADDEKNIRYDYAENLSRLFNGVPGAESSFVGNTALKPYNQVPLDDDGSLILDANGNPKNPVTKQNTIESLKRNPDGSVEATTTRSKDATSDANYKFAINQAGYFDPAWKAPTLNYKNVRDFYEFVENNKENGDANNVGKAFRKLNAIGDNGAIDPKVYDFNYSRKIQGLPPLSYADAVKKLNPVAATTRPNVPGTDVNEKRYILNGKAYKESVLKQQGYDVTKLPLYNQ